MGVYHCKNQTNAYLQNTKLSNIVTKAKSLELYIILVDKGKSVLRKWLANSWKMKKTYTTMNKTSMCHRWGVALK